MNLPKTPLKKLVDGGKLDEAVKRMLLRSEDESGDRLFYMVTRSSEIVPEVLGRSLPNDGKINELIDRLLSSLLEEGHGSELIELLNLIPELKERLLSEEWKGRIDDLLKSLLENSAYLI